MDRQDRGRFRVSVEFVIDRTRTNAEGRFKRVD
jgi:hypothetical protein